ncbi:MAG: inward rectifier potassium channel, partial [Myxococcota bacterium]
PVAWHSNALATVESFIGLVIVAMGTGLVFSKFSRPSARVAFSDKMIVHSRNGVPCLMFRMANERTSQIVEAHLRVSVIKDEVTAEGHHLRRFYHLRLERESSPIFSLTWTAIHPIDENSPLAGLSAETLTSQLAAVVVTFTGIDDTFAQTVHARTSYQSSAVAFNHRFVDMIDRDEHGMMTIHHGRLHHIVPLPGDDLVGMLSPALAAPSSGS